MGSIHGYLGVQAYDMQVLGPSGHAYLVPVPDYLYEACITCHPGATCSGNLAAKGTTNRCAMSCWCFDVVGYGSIVSRIVMA